MNLSIFYSFTKMSSVLLFHNKSHAEICFLKAAVIVTHLEMFQNTSEEFVMLAIKLVTVFLRQDNEVIS